MGLIDKLQGAKHTLFFLFLSLFLVSCGAGDDQAIDDSQIEGSVDNGTPPEDSDPNLEPDASDPNPPESGPAPGTSSKICDNCEFMGRAQGGAAIVAYNVQRDANGQLPRERNVEVIQPDGSILIEMPKVSLFNNRFDSGNGWAHYNGMIYSTLTGQVLQEEDTEILFAANENVYTYFRNSDVVISVNGVEYVFDLDLFKQATDVFNLQNFSVPRSSSIFMTCLMSDGNNNASAVYYYSVTSPDFVTVRDYYAFKVDFPQTASNVKLVVESHAGDTVTYQRNSECGYTSEGYMIAIPLVRSVEIFTDRTRQIFEARNIRRSQIHEGGLMLVNDGVLNNRISASFVTINPLGELSDREVLSNAVGSSIAEDGTLYEYYLAGDSLYSIDVK